MSLLLLVSQAGFAFSVHYCGDEIASVKPLIPFSDNGNCCGKKQEKPMPCCKDKIVKADKDQHSVIKTVSFAFEAVEFPQVTFATGLLSRPSINHTSIPAVSSAHANGPPLYCLFGQYVFYA
ncbi:MAG: hypothetical protein EOO01_25225 [Chitinophagaceae bacterium]|nr:MAG: hypothetical protein EOO01_25225 [Chitinophagaceae bacterium]